MAIDMSRIARSWPYTLANQYTQIDMNCENCVIDEIFGSTNIQQWQWIYMHADVKSKNYTENVQKWKLVLQWTYVHTAIQYNCPGS